MKHLTPFLMKPTMSFQLVFRPKAIFDENRSGSCRQSLE
jgi:hypothetical protein